MPLSDFEFYEDLEKDIAARLAAPFDPYKYNVTPLPDVDSEFEIPQTRGLITVTYKGSEYADELRSTDPVIQNEIITVELTVESKFRRNGPQGQVGVLSALLIIRGLLLGYKPLDCQKMRGGGQEFDLYDDKLWSYGLTFQTNRPAVERADDLAETLLQRVTVDDESLNESFEV